MKLSDLVKQYQSFLLLFVIFIAFIFRFFDLGQIPRGLYQDETAIGYNAYSILTTGKDEWGKNFPLYFKSFGDYKSPVYIYLTVPSLKIFRLSAFAVRLPSALFGLATVGLLYFLVKELSKNDSLALLSSLLLAINPWHLHYSRATFEVSISLFLFLLGTYLLHQALEKQKKALFILGTVCFIIDLYTYNLTRLLSPLLYSAIIFLNRHKLKTINRKEIILTVLIAFVLIVPFLSSLAEKGGLSSARGTLIFSSQAVLASLLEFRSYFVQLPTLLSKLLFNNFFLIAWQFLRNTVSYLSVDFYFLTGSLHGNHGIGTNGQFYLFELVTIILGVYWTIVKKQKWSSLLFWWLGIVAGVASLTREAPHATRSFFLVFPLTVFSAYGLKELVKTISVLKNKFFKLSIFSSFSLLFFFSLIYYFSSYYIRFPVFYADAWRDQDRQLMQYINTVDNDYDEIVFEENSGFIYSSYLFYNRFEPALFQNSVVREPDDAEGFSKVLGFGKIKFKKINWEADSQRPPKRLFIVADDQKLPGHPVKTIYYPRRPVAISLKEKIFQYPVEDIAYYVYESQN